ncbi:MAG: hypothetical protein HY721_14860 [Planctomycetes bacterium]|nr:hypothetical protein [Planctomycetota bacterium]
MGTNVTGATWQATASVRVVDENNTPVDAATVTVRWSGLVTGGTTSGVTNAEGWAGPIYSEKTKASGTITCTVTNISKAGYTYDASANLVTSGQVSRGENLRHGLDPSGVDRVGWSEPLGRAGRGSRRRAR